MKEINKITVLPLEVILRGQIYKALQGENVEKIIRIGKVRKTENQWRYILEGHSFKVDKNISPKLSAIFEEVKKKLLFDEKVDFYITSDANVNAFALYSFEEDEPHIININSSLLNLMDDDELRFIVGHELGHLINQNASLMRLIQFIFPNPDSIPTLLIHKIRLWNQLSELSADRFGFIACPKPEVCISTFFKMSSGLDTRRAELNIEAFLEENERRLDFFKNDEGLNIASHPVNPIRVKAIQLFSNSVYFSTSADALNDEELQKEMDILTNVLHKLKTSELDYHITYFLASAGLITAGVDGKIDKTEIEKIIGVLSDFTIFPKAFLDRIYDEGKLMETFKKSVERILQINPAERYNMMRYILGLIIADRIITDKEFEFVFRLGENILGLSKTEIAHMFGDIIQERFMPDVLGIS